MLALALSACGDEAATPSDGWSGTPPADPVAVGEACELPWFSCVEGSYCKTQAWDAPVCDGLGTCEAIPTTCGADSKPVCGCDGQLYEHACAAARAGVNIDVAEACPPPSAYFACGGEYWEIATQYCMYTWGHGGPPSWDCLSLNCEDALSGCDCITSPTPCGDPEWFPGQFCDDLVDGGTLLQCVPA
jgi:hypothetical protein